MLVINNRQTLLDAAVQHLGDPEKLVEMALLNGVDIDDIEAGTEIKVNAADVANTKIIKGLTNRKIVPASALNTVGAFGEDEWTLYYTTGLPPNHG